MTDRLITRELLIEALTLGACTDAIEAIPVGQPVADLPQSDAIWAEDVMPWAGIGFGDTDAGSGYGYGYGYGYGDGYGDAYGDGYGYAVRY